MTQSLQAYAAFRPRTVMSLPGMAAGGFQIKRYAIVPIGSVFEEARFANARSGLTAALQLGLDQYQKRVLLEFER